MKMRTTLHFLLSAFLLILLTPLAASASDTEPEEISFSSYDFIVYVNEDYDVPLNITPDGVELPEDFQLESTNPDVLAPVSHPPVSPWRRKERCIYEISAD